MLPTCLCRWCNPTLCGTWPPVVIFRFPRGYMYCVRHCSQRKSRAIKGDCVCEHFHGGAMRQSLLLHQVFTFSFTVYWNQAGKSLGDTPPPLCPQTVLFPWIQGTAITWKDNEPVVRQSSALSLELIHPQDTFLHATILCLGRVVPPKRGCDTKKIFINFLDFD